jgi:hypothetical protein
MAALLTEEELARFRGGALLGASPYDRKYQDGAAGFTRLPHCIYFYYVGLDAGKVENIKHYYHDNGSDPIEYGDVDQIAQTLTTNAALGDCVPPQHGSGFKDMIWRRRSYLVFVLDHALFEIWQGRFMEFNAKNGGLENHTFFDAKEFTVQVPTARGPVQRGAFACINHLKNSNGDDLLPGARENFSFALCMRWGNFPEPLTYDPGGTNQGPPVDP